MIAAVADNGVIGVDGHLPWRLPADLGRFRRLTMGHHLVMGRRTFDAIGGPLPGRRIVVLSRNSNFRARGAVVAGCIDDALALVATDGEAFVAGGGEVYRQLLPRATRLYLTRVRAEADGDVCFPGIDLQNWKVIELESHPADSQHEFAYDFAVYER